MKRILLAIGCLIIGFSLGWYFGYIHPVAKHQRELLGEYRYVRENFHMTDAEMAEAGRNVRKYGKDLIRQDELAAAVALAAFKKLESGDTDAAKSGLLLPIGMYYRLYHDEDGDDTLLDRIEAASREYPSIATEISRKVE
jgi:hypothetical protein